MKCPSCSQWIEIQTDPKNAEYQVISGARRKVEGVADPKSLGIKAPKTKEEEEKLLYSPFFRLEHDYKDTQTARESAPKLKQIMVLNEDLWKEDFVSSQSARKKLRAEKDVMKEDEKKCADIRARLGAHDLPLLPEHDRDKSRASSTQFKKKDSINERMAKLKASSVFEKKESKSAELLGRLKLSKTENIVSQLSLKRKK